MTFSLNAPATILERKTILLLLLIFGSVLCSIEATAQRPNVVFVLSDNQSYWEVGYHGNDVIQTPNLDRFASQSVDFTQFYTDPYCSPSRASLLTGRRAMRMRVYDTIGGVSMLPNESTTIAELLRAEGYATGIFGKWHLGDSYPLLPQQQGFETVFLHGGGGVGQLPDYYGNTLFDTTFWENDKPVHTDGFNTDVLFDRAMTFIEKHRDEPFFAFVSTPVTHKPWAAPDAYKKPYKEKGIGGKAALYGQITNLDDNMGRLLKQLNALNLAEDTIVVFMTDQAKGLRGAPEGIKKRAKGSTGAMGWDHRLRVAFTVRYPERVEGDRVENTIASSVDLLPTLAEWCGVSRKPQAGLDGRSLVPLLENPDADWSNRAIVIQCPRGRSPDKWKNATVKTQHWRLVGKNKLFNARRDPFQTNNVADAHPEVLKRLRAKYESFWSEFNDDRPPLVRPVLGSPEQPEVRLVGMDWYKGDKPWTQGALSGNQRGTWAVRVARAGRYRVELRRYPREADKPHLAEHAQLMVGGEKVREREVDPGEKKVTFNVELPSGKTTIKSLFTVANKEKFNSNRFSAYFAYVKWMGSGK